MNIPMNTDSDGCCRALIAGYGKLYTTNFKYANSRSATAVYVAPLNTDASGCCRTITARCYKDNWKHILGGGRNATGVAVAADKTTDETEKQEEKR